MCGLNRFIIGFILYLLATSAAAQANPEGGQVIMTEPTLTGGGKGPMIVRGIPQRHAKNIPNPKHVPPEVKSKG
jgi:hypothetical protein